MSRPEQEQGLVQREERPHGRVKPAVQHDPARAPFSKLQASVGNQEMVRLLGAGGPQPKLRVSQPGDADEIEADRVAEQVTSESSARLESSGAGTSSKAETGPANLRRNASSAQVANTPDGILQDLGPGRPLEPAVRKSMESSFGQDFSDVRVHDDSRAVESARSVNARAFTLAHNVVFDSGEYAPYAPSGKKLLAHELSHVVQQKASLHPDAVNRIQRQARVSTTGPEEKLVDITIGSTQFRGITRTQAITELKRHWRRLHSGLEGDKEGHAYLKQIRDDQYVVGFFADVLGGVRMPPLTIWDKPRVLLDQAKAILDTGDVESGLSKLAEAENAYRPAHASFVEYRDGTISGAERSVTVLKVTAAAGAVAATVATGGIAAEAGLGLLGTSAAVGAAGGTYGATQEFYGQVGEQIAGMRKSFDLAPILKRGAVDAITNFVGAFAGGALSKYATRLFGSYLSKVGDEVLLELGESMGLKGPLPRDFFLTRGQRMIADFLGGVGSTPLTTAVSLVVNRITGGDKIPSAREFASMVIEEMVKGGALQIFIGTILHARAAKGVHGEAPARAGGRAEPVRVAEPAGPVSAEPARAPAAPAPAPTTALAAEVTPVESQGAPPAGAKAAETPKLQARTGEGPKDQAPAAEMHAPETPTAETPTAAPPKIELPTREPPKAPAPDATPLSKRGELEIGGKKLSRDQTTRLKDLRDEMEKLHLDWTDLGLCSKSDFHAFFSEQSSVDQAIRLLERRFRAAMDVRGVHAGAQKPETFTSRTKGGTEPLPTQRGPEVPEGQRLPRGSETVSTERGGFWGGERGNSEWFSDVPEVNKITNYKPIQFKDGFPDFRPWARERIFMRRITGNDTVDFAEADRVLARRRGFSSQTAYANWRAQQRLTWHHVEGASEMILVPRDLHENVPHVGGASEARAGAGEAAASEAGTE